MHMCVYIYIYTHMQTSELQSLLESKSAEVRQLEKSVEGLNEARRQMTKSREDLTAQLQSLQVFL